MPDKQSNKERDSSERDESTVVSSDTDDQGEEAKQAEIASDDQHDFDGSQGQEPEDDEQGARLSQVVEIDDAGPCKRHIKVSIPREDIESQYDEAFSELVDTASVPGFRPGYAPRKLIERRYRRDVVDQVKSSLLMASLQQIMEDYELQPISEPDINPRKIELPDEGSMEYEFNVEVRPEFDVPEYKGLAITRPLREFSDDDVERQLELFLSEHGTLLSREEPARPGDYITTDVAFFNGDQEVNRRDELTLRLQPVLRFHDGNIEKFDRSMKGVTAGDVKKLKVKISQEAMNEELRGNELEAVFEIKEVKSLQLPELTRPFLERFGCETSEEMRGAVRRALERRLEYEQRSSARKQVIEKLVNVKEWDLPEGVMRRQARVALSHRVMEMRRSGFGEAEIRAREAHLWQNSLESTRQTLAEHFMLDRIAEMEKVEIEPSDIEEEIRLLAAQAGESPRRTRARLQKDNLMDDLSTQILERKAIDCILEYAEYEDIPFEEDDLTQVEAVAEHASGDIPEELESEDESEATEDEATEDEATEDEGTEERESS